MAARAWTVTSNAKADMAAPGAASTMQAQMPPVLPNPLILDRRMLNQQDENPPVSPRD
jgi:hypothetical protein